MTLCGCWSDDGRLGVKWDRAHTAARGYDLLGGVLLLRQRKLHAIAGHSKCDLEVTKEGIVSLQVLMGTLFFAGHWHRGHSIHVGEIVCSAYTRFALEAWRTVHNTLRSPCHMNNAT